MKKSFLSKIILSLGLVSLLTLSSCIYNNDSYLDAFDKFVTEVEKAEKDGKIDETTWKNYESKFEEFDESGEPVFAKETRSKTDIEVFEKAQKGIIEYFEKYIELVPEAARIENKTLDEKILSLVNKVQIEDEDFLKLKVEDPFFGRMTDIRDVIG